MFWGPLGQVSQLQSGQASGREPSVGELTDGASCAVELASDATAWIKVL